MLKYSGSSWKSTTKWSTIKGSSAGGFFCTSLAVIILVFTGTAQTDTAETDKGDKGTQDSVIENTGEDTLKADDTSDSSTSGSDTSVAEDSSEGDTLAQDTLNDSLADTLDQVSDSFTVESEDSIEEYIRSIADDTLVSDSAVSDSVGGSSAEGEAGITEEQGFMDYLKARLKGLYLLIKPVLSILLLILIVLIPVAGIYFLIRRAKESRKFLTTTRLSIMDKQIQRACHYIEKNYQNKDLSVQEICNELVIGATFLENLFHKELGMGVQDFINQVRINRALQIIDETLGADNQSIAFDCGYSSEDDFREVFKKVTHVSVEEYRKSMDKQDL